MINANYKGPIKLSAPAGGVVGGMGYIIGSLFVLAVVSIAEGLRFDGEIQGCFSLPKEDTIVFAEGAKVYWDDDNKRVTSVAADNYLIGVCETVAVGEDTDARVYLTGMLVAQEPGA